MDEQTLLADLRSKMDKAVAITRDDLGTIRTGKATPALVENISVAVYGGGQRLKIMEVATISAPDAATIVLQPYDVSIIDEIAGFPLIFMIYNL